MIPAAARRDTRHRRVITRSSSSSSYYYYSSPSLQPTTPTNDDAWRRNDDDGGGLRETTRQQLPTRSSLFASSSSSSEGETTPTTTTSSSSGSDGNDGNGGDLLEIPLERVSERLDVVFDGGEWKSLQQRQCRSRSSSSSSSSLPPVSCGYGSFVAYSSLEEEEGGGDDDVGGGNIDDDDLGTQRRYLAMLAQQQPRSEEASVVAYGDSAARVPSSLSSSRDAIAAALQQGLVVAQALSMLSEGTPGIGGSGGGSDNNENENDADVVDDNFPELRRYSVVVWGGTERGRDLAAAFASMPDRFDDVALVTTKSRKELDGGSSLLLPRSVRVLPPEVVGAGDGDDDDGSEIAIPVCSYIGNFDALIDTLGDELRSGTASGDNDATGGFYNIFDDSERTDDVDFGDDDDDDDDDDVDSGMSSSTSVLRLLRLRHGCRVYLSTVSQSQLLVERHGVLFGPSKAADYASKQSKLWATLPSGAGAAAAGEPLFQPPPGFGRVVETLLNSTSIRANARAIADNLKLPFYQSVGGGGGVGGGSSVLKSPSRPFIRGWSLKDFWEGTTWPRDTEGNVRYGLPTARDGDSLIYDGEQPEEEDEESRSNAATPPILKIAGGATGLQEQVVQPQLTGVVFLSAPYCRTCRTLKPRYTRLARIDAERQRELQDEGDGDDTLSLAFCEADVSGSTGKELARALNVDAVPSFVLFREGRPYGPPLSIGRLPSVKLQRALDLLRSGRPWKTYESEEDR